MVKVVTHAHCAPIWYHSKPSDAHYSPNQFHGWYFFCRFLQTFLMTSQLHRFRCFFYSWQLRKSHQKWCSCDVIKDVVRSSAFNLKLIACSHHQILEHIFQINQHQALQYHSLTIMLLVELNFFEAFDT